MTYLMFTGYVVYVATLCLMRMLCLYYCSSLCSHRHSGGLVDGYVQGEAALGAGEESDSAKWAR